MRLEIIKQLLLTVSFLCYDSAVYGGKIRPYSQEIILHDNGTEYFRTFNFVGEKDEKRLRPSQRQNRAEGDKKNKEDPSKKDPTKEDPTKEDPPNFSFMFSPENIMHASLC